MVKLQRRFAYTYKNKGYYKHVITIPEEVIEKLGWKDGQEIEPSTENGKLVFKPAESEKRRS